LSSFSQISVTITTKNIGSIFFYPKTYFFFLPKTSKKEPKHLDKAINDLKKSQSARAHTHTQKLKINLKTKKPSQV